MSCDAENWLRLPLLALRDRLAADDREFLEKAMLEYGRACVAEAGKAEQPD
jgi:hypothetical protein